MALQRAVVVGVVTGDLNLMMLLAVGWFAVTFTLRVGSALILRWAGRTHKDHTENSGP